MDEISISIEKIGAVVIGDDWTAKQAQDQFTHLYFRGAMYRGKRLLRDDQLVQAGDIYKPVGGQKLHNNESVLKLTGGGVAEVYCF